MTDVHLPLPDRVRAGVAALASRAELVRIDEAAVDRLAASLDPTAPEPFPEERWTGPPQDRAMGVVAWNAVNFGSGWFPHVTKLPGHSGARTMGARWQQHCRVAGVPSAEWLADVTFDKVADVFQQPTEGEVRGLLDACTAAWRELGAHLIEHHAGSAVAMVERADGSVAALAAELGALPCWDDRHLVGGVEVPLYKRAQIVVSNLAGALADDELGRFDDLHTLTAFADNLVPHVLKVAGVLVVDPALDARIEREELLVSGERGEVELRALGVHAVELLVERLRSAGHDHATAASVDHRLWQQGQDPAVKARPATAAGARTTELLVLAGSALGRAAGRAAASRRTGGAVTLETLVAAVTFRDVVGTEVREPGLRIFRGRSGAVGGAGGRRPGEHGERGAGEGDGGELLLHGGLQVSTGGRFDRFVPPVPTKPAVCPDDHGRHPR